MASALPEGGIPTRGPGAHALERTQAGQAHMGVRGRMSARCAYGRTWRARMGVGMGGSKNFKKAIASPSLVWHTLGVGGDWPRRHRPKVGRRNSKMVDFTFTAPKKMQDEGSSVSKSIVVVKTNAGTWTVDGHALSPATVDHCVAFAIKQRLANSYASAGTLPVDKKEPKVLKPLAEREAAFNEMFDAVWKKITDPNSAPSWETVFTGGGESALSPFEAQMARLVRAGLVAWAKAKGVKLPKVGDADYKDLAAKYRAKFESRLTEEANRAIEEAAEAADDFDDFLAGDGEVGGAEEEGDSAEE